MPHTVPKRIHEFLRANIGKNYCDDCIAVKVPKTSEGSINRHQAQQATLAFEVITNEFQRSQGQCSARMKIKKVIRMKDAETGSIL